MGPFAVSDLAGLDIAWRNRKALGQAAPVADALCEAGRLGQKAGRGYYLYPEGARSRRARPGGGGADAQVSARLGVTRRPFPAEEIVERLVYPMVNEGARILEEGIAARARRHRYDLAERLWLAGLARRPDVPCRPGRAEDRARRGWRPSPPTAASRPWPRRRCCAAWPMPARACRLDRAGALSEASRMVASRLRLLAMGKHKRLRPLPQGGRGKTIRIS